jgi:long-subunit fatty acid transport protein
MKDQRHLFVVLLAMVIAPAIANSQETPPTFEFSFSNPGARSLGLGGAFAALADDATAAFANPAGLVQLPSLAVSSEIRHWRYSTPYIEGGRYDGQPTGIGLDTVDGLRSAVSEEQLTGLSFLSFVYPKGNWSIAVYTHQLANFRAQTGTQGLFHTDFTTGLPSREFDRRWSTELDIVSYGVAGAYRLSDRFSLGIGLVYFRGRLDAPFEWAIYDEDTLQSFFSPTSYLPERQIASGEMATDDSDWGLSAGLLWGFAENWSLGAFYRQGPEFRVVYDAQAGPIAPLLDPILSPGATIFAIATPMQFPDVYGLGLAYRSPDGALTVGFEWDRVEYSSIFSSFDPDVIESLDPDLDLTASLVADDGDELRFGAEYAFLASRPLLALRAGVWIDPDHRFRSTSDDPEHQALFQPGEDKVHVALGLGLAFTTFQIDLAADFSDPVDTFSVSAIYSF